MVGLSENFPRPIGGRRNPSGPTWHSEFRMTVEPSETVEAASVGGELLVDNMAVWVLRTPPVGLTNFRWLFR